jgi:hypothetical protein
MLYYVLSRENIVWTRENNFHDITFDVSCMCVISILTNLKNKIIHYGNFQHRKKSWLIFDIKKCRKNVSSRILSHSEWLLVAKRMNFIGDSLNYYAIIKCWNCVWIFIHKQRYSTGKYSCLVVYCRRSHEADKLGSCGDPLRFSKSTSQR